MINSANKNSESKQSSTIVLRRNQIKQVFMTPQQPALNMASSRKGGEKIADLQTLKPIHSASTADESLNQSFACGPNPEAVSSTSIDAAVESNLRIADQSK